MARHSWTMLSPLMLSQLGWIVIPWGNHSGGCWQVSSERCTPPWVSWAVTKQSSQSLPGIWAWDKQSKLITQGGSLFARCKPFSFAPTLLPQLLQLRQPTAWIGSFWAPRVFRLDRELLAESAICQTGWARPSNTFVLDPAAPYFGWFFSAPRVFRLDSFLLAFLIDSYVWFIYTYKGNCLLLSRLTTMPTVLSLPYLHYNYYICY